MFLPDSVDKPCAEVVRVRNHSSQSSGVGVVTEMQFLKLLDNVLISPEKHNIKKKWKLNFLYS